MLGQSLGGLGAVALTAMLQDSLAADQPRPLGIEARPGHHPAKAKRVIWLWMSGGPSQMDTFDPKPEINKLAKEKQDVTEAPFKFAQHGESGMWISELLPNIARHADDLCVIRSMKGDTSVHEHAQTFCFTGVPQNNSPVPTIGNWVVYGLGCEGDNLPAFLSIGSDINPNISKSYFLPAWTQGTIVRHGEKKSKKGDDAIIANLVNRWQTKEQQRQQLDFLRKLNEAHAAQGRAADDRLAARIETFERAFRMQVEAPDAFDLSDETEATKKAYGIGQPETDEYAQRCIIARRMAERGVRFVIVPYSRAPASDKVANTFGWDSHEENNRITPIMCKRHDQPVAALLADLKQRGMLEDTLVFWGGEFGRTAGSRSGKAGREHNANGYTVFLAGGGVKGGLVYGKTGETANGIVENEVHVHDLNATILHLLGLDHEKLTYTASGRRYRLTDVYGNVVRDILA
jgi:hypothetical protein